MYVSEVVWLGPPPQYPQGTSAENEDTRRVEGEEGGVSFSRNQYVPDDDDDDDDDDDGQRTK